MEEAQNIGQFTHLIRWSGVITSIFVVAGVWLVLRVVHRFVENTAERFTSQRMFLQKVETFFQFFMYIATAIAVVFLSLRVDAKVLALIGGTAAVAIGFALKDLVASFVAGIVIMVDRPFQVGDRVSFGGQYGDIVTIGLRSITLQTLDDNTVTIPNNKFMNDITSCGNYGELHMQVVVDVFIGADQDVTLGRRILKEAGISSRYAFLSKPVVVLVDQVLQENLVAVRLRLKAYVSDTRYEKAFGTDVYTRALAAMREQGVAPPSVLYRQLPVADN